MLGMIVCRRDALEERHLGVDEVLMVWNSGERVSLQRGGKEVRFVSTTVRDYTNPAVQRRPRA